MDKFNKKNLPEAKMALLRLSEAETEIPHRSIA